MHKRMRILRPVTHDLPVVALAIAAVVVSGCGDTTAGVLEMLGLTAGIGDSTSVAASNSTSVMFEAQVFSLINERRANGALCGDTTFAPAAPLTLNVQLQRAARRHALDMAARDFFDHTNPDGVGPGERIVQAGYVPLIWGENIASGQPTPEEVVSAWMNSSGHCTNIMQSGFTETGIGHAAQHIWTQEFGAPASSR